jgi:hypothetical protein
MSTFVLLRQIPHVVHLRVNIKNKCADTPVISGRGGGFTTRTEVRLLGIDVPTPFTAEMRNICDTPYRNVGALYLIK